LRELKCASSRTHRSRAALTVLPTCCGMRHEVQRQQATVTIPRALGHLALVGLTVLFLKVGPCHLRQCAVPHMSAPCRRGVGPDRCRPAGRYCWSSRLPCGSRRANRAAGQFVASAPNHVYIGERQPELAVTDEAIDDNVRVEPWWGTQPTTANANCMRRPRALSK
jgi:hypothetical protein